MSLKSSSQLCGKRLREDKRNIVEKGDLLSENPKRESKCGKYSKILRSQTEILEVEKVKENGLTISEGKREL
jgi:hypothetical protein